MILFKIGARKVEKQLELFSLISRELLNSFLYLLSLLLLFRHFTLLRPKIFVGAANFFLLRAWQFQST